MEDWQKELEQWKRIAGVNKIGDSEAKHHHNIAQIIKERGIKLGSSEYMDLAFGRNPKDMSMPVGFRGRVKKR
jgi:hypothetical protein